VPAELLERVLEAARLAPTAANRQPFRLIVMPTSGHEQDLSRVYKSEWFTEAPLVVCACGVPLEAWTRWDGKDYTEVDVAIALDHFVLAAANEGLGTCWIAAFDEDAAREVFKIPETWNPICLTPLGFPNDEGRPKKRKDMSEIVVYQA
jgi:nitroreductase